MCIDFVMRFSSNSNLHAPKELFVLRGSPYPELSKNRFFLFVSIDGTIIREYCRKILQSISE